jgi:poly(hydroxyalkanoate) depolymerase family esterase
MKMIYQRRCSVPGFFQIGALGAVLATSTPAFAGSWQSLKWGGSMTADLYTPTTVDASPGIVVALHYCGGTASNAHSWMQGEADKYGFLIITPQAGGNCFDASPQRSGERDSIAKMVAYVVTNNHADAKRVFAAGASSGACMTQALIAAYPEVFAGGSVLAGVPAGAWTGGNAYGWSTPSKTAAQWGDIVRMADAGFTGARPHVQLWHGKADTTLTYAQNFPAEVLQWTNVLGVSDANSTTSSWKGPQDTWARITYKDASGTVVMETNVADNAPHDLSGRGLWPEVTRFFGLDSDATGGGTGTGGATGSGGAVGTGGTASSSKAGAGGAASSTGGAPGAAGSLSASAGSPSAGGSPGASGTGSVAGGSPGALGGAPSGSSGATGTAGAKPAAGGAPGTGSGDESHNGGGCSVSAPRSGRAPGGALFGLALAAVAAVTRRRRRAS